MLKVLVVDDEAVQVTAFADIIQRLKPEYEILTATDGQEALKIFSEHAADVVITDIRMQGMSGLELIDRITETRDKPEIVILSGYGEFEYARKAINCGVFEYLLKPVSRYDIQDILHRLENKLLQKRSEQSQKEGLIRKLENTLPVYMEHQLNAWVKGELSEEEQDKIAGIFPEHGSFLVLVTHIKRFSRIEGMYTPDELKKLLQRFKFTLKEALPGHSISFYSEKSKGMMTTLLTYDQKTNLTPGQIQSIHKSFIASMQEEIGFSAVTGISNPSEAEDIRKNVTSCFEQAQQAMEQLFYLDDRILLHFPEINHKMKTQSDLYAFEDEMAGILQKSPDSNSTKSIRDIFDKYSTRLNGIKPKKLKEYLIYASIRLIKAVKSFLPEGYSDQLAENIQTAIGNCESYSALKPVFLEFLTKLKEFAGNAETKNNHVIVEKLLKHIQENYMEDLSLEMAASRFHFSPAYFSVVFKNCSGTGFSEYLAAVRIEKAQELLKHTNFKVYEISEKVGYRDAAYFNRIFRREVGISPYKYRQISGDF